MNSVFIFCFLISILTYYFLNTNVVYEYIKYIPKFINKNFIKNIFYGKLMIKSFEVSGEDNYILYLNSVYNNFITKLISCPICIGFWMSLISSIYIGNILYFPFIAYLSLIFYFVLNILTKLSHKI